MKDELKIPGLFNVAVAKHLYSLFPKIEKASCCISALTLHCAAVLKMELVDLKRENG